MQIHIVYVDSCMSVLQTYVSQADMHELSHGRFRLPMCGPVPGWGYL